MTHPPPDRAPFDRELIAHRMSRLKMRGPAAMPDFLHRAAAEEITARLAAVNRHFNEAVVCATAPMDLAESILALDKTGRLRHAAPLAMPRGGGRFDLVIDPEAPPFAPESLDLFISVFDLALVNDLPGALAAIRRALRPDGLFMAALPGGESLHELRTAWAAAETALFGDPTPRVAPFCGVRQLGSLLQLAGFALPVVDAERITVRYADALSLMAELKAMGWANPLRERSRRPTSRRLLAQAAAEYEAAFTDADGRIPATFEIIHLAAWAPHESQPRPLRPGSARMPLGRALSGACPVPGKPPVKDD